MLAVSAPLKTSTEGEVTKLAGRVFHQMIVRGKNEFWKSWMRAGMVWYWFG